MIFKSHNILVGIKYFCESIKNIRISKQKLFILLISAVYTLVVFLFMASQFGGSMKQTLVNVDSGQSDMYRSYLINDIIASAEKQINAGNIKAIDTIFDSAISKTNDSYKKSILLLAKATVYLNIDDYDAALRYAIEGSNYDENDQIYGFIAQIYEKQSKYSYAIDSYRNALLLIDDSKPAAGDDINFFEYKISELGKKL